MYGYDYHRLRAQVAILKDVVAEYPTASISNAIMQLESRIKHIEKNGS